MKTEEWIKQNYPTVTGGPGGWAQYQVVGRHIWEVRRGYENKDRMVADLPSDLVHLEFPPLALCGEHGYCEEFSDVDLIVPAERARQIVSLYDAVQEAIAAFQEAAE